MLASRQLPRALLRRGVPLATRWSLLAVAVRRRLRPAPTYFVTLGKARVPISHADYGVDWETVRTIVVDRAYELEYRNAVVVDVGAHKGCYGAFALEAGAKAVLSYEPEETNYSYLAACAAAYPEQRATWRTTCAAVSGWSGNGELHVMSASWGHALAPSADAAEDEVGLQHVPVVAMADVLEEAGRLAAGDRLIVKINAEGAECDIVLATSPAAWERVDDVLVEVHGWAPCTLDELVEHLAAAGLAARPSENASWVHRLSR